ncbi:hypothetical protein JYB87_11835 [Shewanella avicenniae]|uniref:Uncharacterized protein n=1 Tax=Shewanella avicenniae TaxID=2814294 RepID=A0ABX7QLX5_9GAMM|nr:phage tail tube protein [Shewanella avicenniae]QSX32457.1 hypothetical protein JYB87_11835 [Shewanella avicenniae]
MATRKTAKKVLAAAINQAAYGSDAIQAAGQPAFILTTGLDITPMDGDTIDRELDDGSLGNSMVTLVGTYVSVTGSVEIAGAGTATNAPAWEAIMVAAGYAGAAGEGEFQFSRVTDNTEKDITVYVYRDGALHKVTGARGNITYNLNVQEVGTIEFELTGLYGGIVTQSMPAKPDFSGFLKPVPVGATYTTISIGGQNVKAYSFQMNETNTVEYDENTQAETVDITELAPTGSITILAEDLAAFNPFDIAKNETPLAMTVTHGTAAGNIFVLNLPVVQLMRPAYGDQNGRLTYEIEFNVIGTQHTVTTK